MAKGLTAAFVFSCFLLFLVPGFTLHGHAVETSKKATNHLSGQKSLYLMQHATNPVDWYPWGEEAFEKAGKENKPVFLSIGYFSCHWCLVMEKESFMDETVAKLLNDNFVAIKVDREERPDIDNLYMAYLVSMTGGGGWPMTIVTTPDKEPLFAGTYFPKDASSGLPGLTDILSSIARQWKEDTNKLVQTGKENGKRYQALVDRLKPEPLDSKALDRGCRRFTSTYDGAYGGFGHQVKFPNPIILLSLMRLSSRGECPQAMDMVEGTLAAMRKGGIYDHIGFGIHRYATDRKWLYPHFEKMLYDQALVAMAFIEAYQITGKETYAATAREIFEYVLTRMTSAEGAFYSSESADSEGKEGLYYTWTCDEITSALEPVFKKEEGRMVCSYYGVTPKGNFEGGRSVLHSDEALEDFALKEGIELGRLTTVLDTSRRKLAALRDKRVPPPKDDKILADWNGLMIAALAKGAMALDDKRYADAAAKAADFVLKKMRTSQGRRLLHRYRDGEAQVKGFLDDYAFFIWGLTELYEATFKTGYLEDAMSLATDMVKLFADPKRGMAFISNDDKGYTTKAMGALSDDKPSGISIAALDLARLGALTMNKTFQEKAGQIMVDLGGPWGGETHFIPAVDFSAGPSREVVVTGDPGKKDTQDMIGALRRAYLPRVVAVFRPDSAEAGPVERIAPSLQEKKMKDGKATAYVCSRFACAAPTTDVKEMLSQAQGK